MLGGRLLCACWASNCWLESEPPTHPQSHARAQFCERRDLHMYSQPDVAWHACAMYTQTIMHACSMVEQVRPHGTRWVSWRLNAAVLWSVGGPRTYTHTSGSNNVLRKCCSCWRCCVRPNVQQPCEDGRFKKRCVLHTSQTTPPLTVEHRRPVESGSGQLRPTDTHHRRGCRHL